MENKTYATVIGVVMHKDKILLMKRTPERTCSPNLWEPPSGHIGEHEPAEEAVLREVFEETGFKGQIEKTDPVFELKDNYGIWMKKPFLIVVKSNEVVIDMNEHAEIKWIHPKDYVNFDCVAGVKEVLEKLNLI